MSAKQCLYSHEGRVKQFYCGYSQLCCEKDCCNPQAVGFYTHWYFWLAVVVLVIFLIAAIVSGYCRFKRPPPYRLLGILPGQTQNALLPWIWSLDEETGSSAVNSPRDFRCGHTSQPFVFPSTSPQASPCLHHPIGEQQDVPRDLRGQSQSSLAEPLPHPLSKEQKQRMLKCVSSLPSSQGSTEHRVDLGSLEEKG